MASLEVNTPHKDVLTDDVAGPRLQITPSGADDIADCETQLFGGCLDALPSRFVAMSPHNEWHVARSVKADFDCLPVELLLIAPEGLDKTVHLCEFEAVQILCLCRLITLFGGCCQPDQEFEFLLILEASIIEDGIVSLIDDMEGPAVTLGVFRLFEQFELDFTASHRSKLIISSLVSLPQKLTAEVNVEAFEVSHSCADPHD